MFRTLEEAKRFIEDNSVSMLDFKMVDIEGRWRHVTLPASRLTPELMQYGIGFDGSNYGFAPVENSDMVFIPDLSTAAMDPFAKTPTLMMTGDVMVIGVPHNRPFDQYPRNVLRRATEHMKSLGVADKMIIGPEFEFHIFEDVRIFNEPHRAGFELASDEAYWSGETVGGGQQLLHKRGYHADLPQDIHFDLRSRMCELIDSLGVGVKYHHHEVGSPAQEEIETEMGEVNFMADATMIVKYVVKNAACQSGKCATFMPKPIYGEAGNGMHVHIILQKEGKPVFYSEEGYGNLSKTALYFIGGLLKHAPSLCALTNPSTNSFKRLVPGYEAPVTIGYAMANRSAVVRIPAYAKSPESKRFELRNPDATCNPYYAYAAILMAGLDGIVNKIDPAYHNWGPFDFNLFDLPEVEKAKIDALPTNLDDALAALENDCDYLKAGGVFPERLIKVWIRQKRKELAAMNGLPTAPEFERYFSL
ncbi:MAG: type I glutamate--ammonia ligase [Clostridia bacterium]|nr:type I glutamate--ammonia ligase [Clostridia bacterium]